MKLALNKWMGSGFVPVRSYGWEWFFMRLGLASIVMWILFEPHPFQLGEQSAPVGLARLIDFSAWFTRPSAHGVVLVLGAVLSLGYLWGRGLLWWTAGLCLLLCSVRSYFNSQGYTHHGTQLVTLCLLTQCLTLGWLRWRKPDVSHSSYLIYYTQGIILISYVASALTKIINSKGLWLWRSKYICVEFIKTHRLDYHRELDPTLAGDPPLALWMLHHPLLTQILFAGGFFIELLAIAGLHSRKWALWTGIVIIVFHQTISRVMKLHFDNHQLLAAVFLVNLPFWIWVAVQRKSSPLQPR
jgi:hypothetical protein